MDDDEPDLQAMGFLFDAAASKAEVRFTVGDQAFSILCIADDDPGALQSGQYVWPAAQALASYVVEQLESGKLPREGVCVELGAGCGLCGIAVACCPAAAFQQVVLTDHDPGTSATARRNIELQEDRLRAEVRTEQLQWGEKCSGVEMASLMLGSDVIYDVSVVEPLFKTVDELLLPVGVFVMCQSFPYPTEIEAAIDVCCERYRLSSDVVYDHLDAPASTKLRTYRRQWKEERETTKAAGECIDEPTEGKPAASEERMRAMNHDEPEAVPATTQPAT